MKESIVRLILIAIFSLGAVSVADFAAARQIQDPHEKLSRDVKFLELMIQAELAGYPLPLVKIIPEEEMDKMYKEALKSGTPTHPFEGYVGYTDETCRENVIWISGAYERLAKEVMSADRTAKDYFFLVRFHELYHWSQCRIFGEDRWWGGGDKFNREERLAGALERQYYLEQTGPFKAALDEYLLPPKPRRMEPGTLPTEELYNQLWTFVEDRGYLTPWDTADGGMIFVYVARAIALGLNLEDAIQNFDLPSQHIPDYRYIASAKFRYFYAVMHRGKYVGFEIFETPRAFAGQTMGGLTRVDAWYDKGYVPPQGEGPAPANPTYVGEWVQIYPKN